MIEKNGRRAEKEALGEVDNNVITEKDKITELFLIRNDLGFEEVIVKGRMDNRYLATITLCRSDFALDVIIR